MTETTHRFGGKALVIGTGLIGGSVAAGLTGNGWSVWGYDADPDVAQQALDLGLVTDGCSSIEEGLASKPDLVVVAAPPKATVEILSSLATEAVVMDVSGIKAPMVDVAQHLPKYVGTHPMAGRETSGPEAASAALFSGASWVIVEAQDEDAAQNVESVVELLGARPLPMTAADHDRAVALISHLPHLVAGGLLEAALEDEHALDLAAGSFRDLTRVGASHPLPWVEILKTNNEAVLDALGALRRRLAAIEAAILTDDDTLLTMLTRARDTRRALGSPVAQVRIALADKPGELAKVGHAFEASGVDIRDIQMRHAPYGGGGVLTLSVRPGEQGALTLALEAEGLLIIP